MFMFSCIRFVLTTLKGVFFSSFPAASKFPLKCICLWVEQWQFDLVHTSELAHKLIFRDLAFCLHSSKFMVFRGHRFPHEPGTVLLLLLRVKLEEGCSSEAVSLLLQLEQIQAQGQAKHHKLQPGQPSWLKKFRSAVLVAEIWQSLSVYNVY